MADRARDPLFVIGIHETKEQLLKTLLKYYYSSYDKSS